MNNILSFLPFIGIGIVALVALWMTLSVLGWRVVVPTNKVHIVQTSKKTISYGVGEDTAGNVYYRVPPWVPIFGITVTEMSTSIIQLDIAGYKAYDKDRVPFDLDVIAFFRVFMTGMAASRVNSAEELKAQLLQVVQGAVRKILASYDIHQIMTDRATFGAQFTEEVGNELKEWGVQPVKNLELIDIRDEKGSNVISSIMQVKTSQIESDSRIAVAKNEQLARSAEIASKQTIAMSEQLAAQQLGERTAQQEQAVGIAKEQAEQAIQEQLALTASKQMAVKAVETQRQAEITRDAAIVAAEQAQKTTVINASAAKTVAITQAEASKETAELQAAATLAAAKASAESTKLKGEAEGAAKLANELAPVNAQLALAEGIGGNQPYQDYLIRLETVKVTAQVGIAQAEALKTADLKIIANGGDIQSGITGLGDIFTAKGATTLTGALSALTATPEGQALVAKFVGPLIATKVGEPAIAAPTKKS